MEMTAGAAAHTPALPSAGVLLISLDFELHWGVMDKRTVADYGDELRGEREVIPRMLDLFNKYDVHATWATVGFLFHATKEELLAALPALRPVYQDPRHDPYRHLDAIGPDEQRDPYHFGASLVREIGSRPGQEIASHTYSHYYCLEAGQSEATFDADLDAAVRVASTHGIRLKSLVFPRNQYNPAYLQVARKHGFIAYRGNPDSWMDRAAHDANSSSLLRRVGRFADAMLPLRVPELTPTTMGRSMPIDLPATRFLRLGRNGVALLDRLHERRVEGEMTAAAQRRTICHLWWHPHNFGVKSAEKLAALERLLRHFRQLRDRFGFTSLSMAELAEKNIVCNAPSR